MEDSKGFLSFNFEGSLNVAPSSSFAVAPSSLLILHNSSTIAFAGSNKGPAAPTPSAVGLMGSDNVPDQWNFRQMVCRHWLHHLCMKGDAYGFLHQYNKARMLVCRFFRLYGEYWKHDGTQRDSSIGGVYNKQEEEKAITRLLDGSENYTLIYEDNEGDMMLVGDRDEFGSRFGAGIYNLIPDPEPDFVYPGKSNPDPNSDQFGFSPSKLRRV
ncbi:hypothetical protein JHK82_022798 [Glycine max]|nr:hypothetical protein JHK82_022798 [Glycine max]